MNLASIFKPLAFTSEVHVGLKYFAETLTRDEVDFNPSYQRGHCWTQTQKEEFLGHFLTGGDVNALVLQRVPDEGHAEMLDGKQRATAILEWLDNKVGANIDGTLLFRREVEKGLDRVTIRVRYINLPWEARKSFYIKLNSAGTPHTAADIEAARSATETR